jgi:hypothetical protein
VNLASEQPYDAVEDDGVDPDVPPTMGCTWRSVNGQQEILVDGQQLSSLTDSGIPREPSTVLR